MKRFVFAAALAVMLSALAIGTSLANAGKTVNVDKTQRHIPVKTLTSTRMPVGIASATATAADNGAVLSYSLTNRSAQRLTALQVVAFVIDSNGIIKAGEGWTLSTDLARNATETFSVILENKPASEGRLAVAVWKASGPSGAFEVENSEIVSQAKSYAASAATTTGPVFTKASYAALLRQTTYCQNALNMATNTCSCGVGSFSCNDANQSFSFTCNKPPEGQSECVSGPTSE